MTADPIDNLFSDPAPVVVWDPIAHAVHFARHGMRVTSLIGKRPWREGWPDLSTTNVSDVVQDFEDAIRRAGSPDLVWVGWALGMPSAIGQSIALDVDAPDLIDPELRKVLDAGGYAENRTSKPGKFHAIYEMPAGRTVGNGVSKFPSHDWGQVRGFHGQIVAAGPDRPGFDVTELVKRTPFSRPNWLSDHMDAGSPATTTEVAEFFAANDERKAMRKLDTILAKAADPDWKASRHERARDALGWAMRDARIGLFPAKEAAEAISVQFLDAVRGDTERARNYPHPEREIADLVARGVGLALEMTDQDVFDRRWDAVAAGTLPLPINGVMLGDVIDVDQSADPGDPADVRPGQAGDDMVELIDWTEIHDPADDIVQGLLMPGRWTQFVAPAKVGKSTLMLFIAIELSEGRDPFDGTPIDPVTVLYCDGEMGRRDLEELIRACGHDPKDLRNLHSTNERTRLDRDTSAARLLRRVDQLAAKVVVLDGLNGFVNPQASENDDNTWRQFVAATIDLLKQRGVAIASGDNMGKDRTKGSRGSSVKTDKADGVLELKRIDSGIRLHASHSHGGAYITADLDLEAEGLDRSRPIRYRRTLGGWPVGTKEAAALLDSLGVPTGEGRDKVRKRLHAEIDAAEAAGLDPEGFRVGNDALAAAIRWRKTNP